MYLQTLDFVKFSAMEKCYEGELFIQPLLRFCNSKNMKLKTDM